MSDPLPTANWELTLPANIERLACAVHEFYLELAKKEGWTPTYPQPYGKLPEDIKADNRAAAARIRQVLSLIGLHVSPQGTVDGESANESAPAEIRRLLEDNLEVLAEAEHNGWVEHKLRSGWRYGSQRDDAARVHNLLVTYCDLEERQKQKDRNAVLCYPAILERVNYRITSPSDMGRAVS